MPKCVIDGHEVEFTAGQNLIEVAKKAGVSVPYFCYHPGLTVVAQCRMCAVEIEKMPKLQTACSTPATEGMVVKTQSSRVLQAQKSTMEFLLINHPLDCPICDKSGECDLQDHSYHHGDAYSRFTEERRTYMDLDMGPVIKKNMNRCIHCTRCIRFGEEVAGVHEMIAVKRGNNTEITTLDGRPLETDYAGNYSDICPTGSLTLKDFRFKKRVWFLKKTQSICEGCSRGCNIEIHQEDETIYRLVPRENMQVNKFWICDEGRFGFHYIHSKQRVIEPHSQATLEGPSDLSPSDWGEAIDVAKARLSQKKLVVLVGSDLTLEEGLIVKEFLTQELPQVEAFHFGTPGVLSVQDDSPVDRILKRKNKTGNLNGIEKLGFKGFKALASDVKAALIIRGGKAVLPELPGLETVVGLGVFESPEVTHFAAVLPGTTFAEKDGTLVNFEGREQKIRRAILPPGQCKALSEILMMWTHRKTSTGAA